METIKNKLIMRHLLFITVSFLLLSCIAGNAKTVNDGNLDPAVDMLKEFYAEYISLNLCDEVDDASLLNLKEKYLTPSLLMKLRSSVVDFDPFVNAQDFSQRWLTEIDIAKIDSLDNLYTVMLPDNKDCIIVKVICKEGGKYLIDNISYNRDNSLVSCVQDSSINTYLGTWVISEEQPFPYIAIRKDSSAYVVVESDQIMINAKLVPDTSAPNNSYQILLVAPAEELGIGGQRLDWSHLSTTHPVGHIQFLSNNTARYTWLGFYNTITKQRVWKDSQFTREMGDKTINLIKVP